MAFNAIPTRLDSWGYTITLRRLMSHPREVVAGDRLDKQCQLVAHDQRRPKVLLAGASTLLSSIRHTAI
jgi:hypothetical protein